MKIPIFPGKYHQNGSTWWIFHGELLVYRRVPHQCFHEHSITFHHHWFCCTKMSPDDIILQKKSEQIFRKGNSMGSLHNEIIWRWRYDDMESWGPSWLDPSTCQEWLNIFPPTMGETNCCFQIYRWKEACVEPTWGCHGNMRWEERWKRVNHFIFCLPPNILLKILSIFQGLPSDTDYITKGGTESLSF